MSLTLSAETQKLIEDRMTRGDYSSPDDLVREALNVLDQVEEDELDENDLAAIEESEQQIARGEDLDWKEVSAQLRRKYLGE